MTQMYKNNIDAAVRKIIGLPVSVVYGGATAQTLEERKVEHISTNDPPGCDHTWEMYKVTTINVTEVDKAKEAVKVVEQYLIDELKTHFENRCVNYMKLNGDVAQTGGRGIRIQEGDRVLIYIFYKPGPSFVFV